MRLREPKQVLCAGNFQLDLFVGGFPYPPAVIIYEISWHKKSWVQPAVENQLQVTKAILLEMYVYPVTKLRASQD